MPNIKSAKKRVEVAERNRQRNMNVKSSIRTAVKKVISAVESGEKADSVQSLLNEASSLIDRAVLKGIIHKNTGARYKSRLMKLAGSSA